MTIKTELTLMSLYDKHFRKNKNFMTPEVVKVKAVEGKNMVVEFSKGTGFSQQPIYGVAVWVWSDTDHELIPSELGQLHEDLVDAKNHFEKLTGETL